MKAPQTGRGLPPLPIRDYDRCLHGVDVASDCKRCEADIRRIGKAKVPA